MNDETRSEGARRRRRLRTRLARGIVYSALTLVVLLGAGWWWLETDAAAERLRVWVQERASRSLERPVTISSLEIDVFPFHLSLDGLRVGGEPGADAPFLTVEQTDVEVWPWTLANGRLEIAALELHRPTVHVDLGPDGSTNVPRLVRQDDGDGWHVDVRRLEVDDGTVVLNHRPTSVDAVLADLAATMRPTASGGRAGSLRFAGGTLAVDADGRSAQLHPVDLRLRFEMDPEEVHLDDLVLQLGASRVRGSGTVQRWAAAHLELRGSIELTEVERLVQLPGPTGNSGHLEIEGTFDYDGVGPRLQGTLTGDDAAVAGVELTDLVGRLEIGADRVRVDEVDVGVFGGRVRGSVGLELGAASRSWLLSYSAVGVDLARMTAWEGLPGIRLAGVGDATGELRWDGPFRETVDGEGEIDLRVPPRSLAEVFPATGPPPVSPAPTGEEPPAQASSTVGQAGTPRAVPSLPLPLSASASYGLQDGVLTVESSRARLPGTEVRLQGHVDLDGRIDGAVRVESGDLRMLDRFFNQVRRFRGEQPTPRPLGLRGAGRLDVQVGGQLRRPDLEGTMVARGLEISGDPVGDLEGRLQLAGNALRIEDLEVRRGAGSARGRATFRVGAVSAGEDDYRVDATLERYPLELDLSRTDVRFAIHGPADGEIRLSGDYGRPPVGRVEAAARAVELNGVGPFQARLQVRLTEPVWYAERVELEGKSGRIELTGYWSRSDDTISARLAAREVDAAVLGALLDRNLPVAGRLRAEARIRGRSVRPDATLRTWWQAAHFRGVPVGDVGAAVRLSDGRAALSLVGGPAGGPSPEPPAPPQVLGSGAPPPLPGSPAAGWVAAAAVPLETDEPVLRFRAAGSARWAPALLQARGTELPEDLRVEGVVDAFGSLPLDDWRAGRIRATVANLQLELGEIDLQAPPPMIVELRDGILELEVPTLLSPDGSFSANATLDVRQRRWIEATASGHLEMEVLRLLWPGLATGGHLNGRLQASGSLDDTVLEGRIELMEIAVEHPSWPYPVREVTGAVRLTGDGMELVDVRGLSADQEFNVSGVLPLGALAGDPGDAPVELELEVAELPLDPAFERSAAVSSVLSGGAVSLRARISGRGLDWRAYAGTVALNGLQVRVVDLPVRLSEESELQLRDGTLELPSSLRFTGPGTDLGVAGTVALSPFSLDLETDGILNLDPLNALVEEWGIAGRADVDLHLQGRPPDLAYRGTVEVRSGLVSPPPLGQPVEDIEAVLELEDRDVRVAEFRGRLGGGAVVASGSLQLRDSVPRSFNLALSVEDALLRLEPEVRLTVAADLMHEGTGERSVLSGSIFVDQGEYTRRWEPGDPLLEVLEQQGGGDSPFLQSVNLDMTVDAPRDLRVENNIADLQLQADLEIRGTLADPVLLGRAAVVEGDVTWQDNTFRILQGTVEFQNPVRTEPTFDVRAETNIREYLVTLTLSGSLESQIQLDYSSSPPLSDLEFWRLLALGQTPQTDGTGQGDTNLGNVGLQASNFLTAQYLNEVTRGAQRVFGVDRFRIEPTIFGSSADPTARVTVGEQVTRNLLVNYSTVLGQGDEQLITVEYQLTRGIRVIGTREEDGSFGLDFHFDHRF